MVVSVGINSNLFFWHHMSWLFYLRIVFSKLCKHCFTIYFFNNCFLVLSSAFPSNLVFGASYFFCNPWFQFGNYHILLFWLKSRLSLSITPFSRSFLSLTSVIVINYFFEIIGFIFCNVLFSFSDIFVFLSFYGLLIFLDHFWFLV